MTSGPVANSRASPGESPRPRWIFRNRGGPKLPAFRTRLRDAIDSAKRPR